MMSTARKKGKMVSLKKCAEQWKMQSAVVDLADQSRNQRVQALKMFSWKSRT